MNPPMAGLGGQSDEEAVTSPKRMADATNKKERGSKQSDSCKQGEATVSLFIFRFLQHKYPIPVHIFSAPLKLPSKM